MSQILFEDYSYEKAYIVVSEMALAGCQELMRRRSICRTVGLSVGYSKDISLPTGGSVKMATSANTYSQIKEYVERIYKQTTIKNLPIRRLSVTFDDLSDESSEGYDLFTDIAKIEREKKLERTVLNIKDKYGKNAMLRGMDLEEGATTMVRNKLIGGHNANE